MSTLDEELQRVWKQMDGSACKSSMVYVPHVGAVPIKSSEAHNYFRRLVRQSLKPRHADGGTSVP